MENELADLLIDKNSRDPRFVGYLFFDSPKYSLALYRAAFYALPQAHTYKATCSNLQRLLYTYKHLCFVQNELSCLQSKSYALIF